ncbi:MAG: LCP family protein [Anaerolineaceae bacterium]|nr:LCP family protein [Anaerolineaceae bacterium]
MSENETTANDQQTAVNQRSVENSAAAPTIPRNNPVVIPSPTYYNGGIQPPPPPNMARESAARERMRRRRVQSRRGGEWAWVVIGGALLAVAMISSMTLFVLLRASSAEQEILPTAVIELPTPVDARNAGNGETPGSGTLVTLDDGRTIELSPWDGNSRFTILMVGIDRRPGETGLAYRTDTMLLVSIDPVTNSLGILSIPRDLYVEVPGYAELQRVNSPMVLGELQRPGYGPQLMMQTVQYNLGMRIHDYVVVDFRAFIALVDAVGGVDVETTYNISDPIYPDMNYGYDPFYLPAGQHHLDGATALKFARTRHGSSDFQRAQRQQQVLFAIRDRVLNLQILPQLIIQAPSLWNQLSQNINTGLSVDQLIHLALYLKDIPVENIHTGVIDQSYTIGYTTSVGASVLVPDRARIGPLMVDVFGANYSQ